jgi:uncharacterized glyoxalase superfamily protein PhnB
MTNTHTPQLKHLTPVLVVERVEPSVAFWVGRLGFTAENSVPGGDGTLVFASVKRGDIEVMFQTRASVAADLEGRASEFPGTSAVLFITTDQLDDVQRAVADAPVVKPRHQTFYGSTELYVREPGGHIVGFAQF